MILSVKSEGLCDLLLNVYKVLYFLLDRSPKTGFCDLVQFYLSWRASRYPCIFLEESALVSLGSPLQLVFFQALPVPRDFLLPCNCCPCPCPLSGLSQPSVISPNLPELEDDACSHKNNDDGYSDCDIKLGVHT